VRDEDRKILTEFLGERWHEIKGQTKGHGNKWMCTCHTTTGDGYWEKEDLIKHINNKNKRTFTTWEDFGALWEKIDKKNLFISWLHQDYYEYLLPEAWRRWERERSKERCFIILEAIKEGVLK